MDNATWVWLGLFGVLVGSWGVWFFLYAFSLAMNGAMHPFRVFHYLKEEIGWLEVFPGWKKRRAKYLNIVEGEPRKSYESDIYMLPGIKDFLIRHVLIPFGPAVAYICWW